MSSYLSFYFKLRSIPKPFKIDKIEKIYNENTDLNLIKIDWDAGNLTKEFNKQLLNNYVVIKNIKNNIDKLFINPIHKTYKNFDIGQIKLAKDSLDFDKYIKLMSFDSKLISNIEKNYKNKNSKIDKNQNVDYHVVVLLSDFLINKHKTYLAHAYVAISDNDNSVCVVAWIRISPLVYLSEKYKNTTNKTKYFEEIVLKLLESVEKFAKSRNVNKILFHDLNENIPNLKRYNKIYQI